MKKISEIIEEELKQGHELRMNLYGKNADTNDENDYHVIMTMSNEEKVEFPSRDDGYGAMSGHSVCIVGQDEDGIIISTWGDRVKIEYQDIVDNQFYISLWRDEF